MFAMAKGQQPDDADRGPTMVAAERLLGGSPAYAQVVARGDTTDRRREATVRGAMVCT
jgi:hypothetical protein